MVASGRRRRRRRRGGRRSGYHTKNQNPTRQCGKITTCGSEVTACRLSLCRRKGLAVAMVFRRVVEEWVLAQPRIRALIISFISISSPMVSVMTLTSVQVANCTGFGAFLIQFEVLIVERIRVAVFSMVIPTKTATLAQSLTQLFMFQYMRKLTSSLDRPGACAGGIAECAER